MHSKMLGALILACLLVGGLPALAGGPQHFPRSAGRGGGSLEQGAFRIKLGLFTPDGDSEFWDENKLTFSGDAKDLEDVSYAGELFWSLNARASLAFSVGYLEGAAQQSYLGLVDEFGAPIEHTSTLSVTPVTAAIVLHPAGRNLALAPYLGFGGGLYWWRYREAGDFVDFVDPEQPILFQVYHADGVSAGFFFLAGLEIPVRPSWSFFAEAKWQRVRDELNKDFEGFGAIDLSGTEVGAGLSWRF